MIIHNYPLPTNKHQFTMDGFRFTKKHYSPVTGDSPMYAIDCEMCYLLVEINLLEFPLLMNN